eukprot:GEMP01025375.1.p2 GENE.GEMP01025375.1~~GEMP01025375.1.p2  ORF type:complete len:177 (+),score=26.96 GEMP01025375.1:27-533(+)
MYNFIPHRARMMRVVYAGVMFIAVGAREELPPGKTCSTMVDHLDALLESNRPTHPVLAGGPPLPLPPPLHQLIIAKLEMFASASANNTIDRRTIARAQQRAKLLSRVKTVKEPACVATALALRSILSRGPIAERKSHGVWFGADAPRDVCPRHYRTAGLVVRGASYWA